MKDIGEMPSKVCIVVGVGEGLGAALARRFADRYKVELIARTPDVIPKPQTRSAQRGGIALPLRHSPGFPALGRPHQSRTVSTPNKDFKITTADTIQNSTSLQAVV